MSTPFDNNIFNDDMTLGAARDALRKLVYDGAICPCCKQLAKVYQRSINSGMAHSLIVMFNTAKFEWQHVPTTVGGKSREEGKLRYWGLVEEECELRDDGGRAGWWRVTPLGGDFVNGRVKMKQYALVYNARCLDLEGEQVTIVDALGSKFNYDDLMSNRGLSL